MNIMNNLLAAASFIPDLLDAETAWLGHLPFANFLMREQRPKIFVELGTHYGHSYFAFCKTVIENGMETKCFAVDTWQGDEHAGNYGEDIYSKVRDENENKYSKFSSLLRMTFDEAAKHFRDGTIDLLHIDGLHTFDAVKNDFETWLPKLAPGAIVLFHDTNVRERDFGVWKLWGDLVNRYPNNLEFLHSYGLGVIQLKLTPEARLLPFLDCSDNQKKEFVDYFAALGTAQSQRHRAIYIESLLTKANLEIASLNETNRSLNERVNIILNSRSWKLTSPLRSVFGLLKKLFK